MKLRITDGRTHAVEFEAGNDKQCRHASIQAAAEFAPNQPLEVHVWDGEAWCGVRQAGGTAPIYVTQRKLFSGVSLWEHVESSYQHARTMIEGCSDLKAWIRRTSIRSVTKPQENDNAE